MSVSTTDERTLRADELTNEWIGWLIRPLRDEFVKGQGGLDGMLITHGRSFELKSIRTWERDGDSTVELVAKDDAGKWAGIAYHYPANTVVELLRPLSARARKGAKTLGYDTRKHRWLNDAQPVAAKAENEAQSKS